jgi:hypothetical protein
MQHITLGKVKVKVILSYPSSGKTQKNEHNKEYPLISTFSVFTVFWEEITLDVYISDPLPECTTQEQRSMIPLLSSEYVN